MGRFWKWLAGLAGPVQPLPERGAALISCAKCGAEAVIPVAWQDGGDKWWIAVRCGNCGDRREVTLADDEAGAFAGELDRGVEQIARAAATLEHKSMRAAVESLAIALERDLIGADDFASRSYVS